MKGHIPVAMRFQVTHSGQLAHWFAYSCNGEITKHIIINTIEPN